MAGATEIKAVVPLPVQRDDDEGVAAAQSESGPVLTAVAKPDGAAVRIPSPRRSEASGVLEVLSARQQIGMSVRRHATAFILACLSITGLVLFWHLATENKWVFYIRFNNVPTPSAVFGNLVEMAGNPKFQANIGMSLKRILTGFAMATGMGLTLGLLCGRFRMVRGLMFPAMEVLRPIPAIAWVPISIMLWPTTETSIVFITFIGAFFPIFMNTMAGVKSVDPVLLRAAQALGANEATVLLKVILPAALPNVFTGLAVGMGVAWVSLIAAEMISGQFGVGYFTWEAYSLIEYPNIVLGMGVIGVLGLTCSGCIVWVSRMLMPWTLVSGKGSER